MWGEAGARLTIIGAAAATDAARLEPPIVEVLIAASRLTSDSAVLHSFAAAAGQTEDPGTERRTAV